MTDRSITQNQDQTEPMIERYKFDTMVFELRFLRQHLRELRRQIELRRVNEAGEVWYWQSEGGNHPESLVCPVVIPAADLRALLSARDPVPKNDQIQHDVIARAYDFTIDWDGNVMGLIAGDMGYEHTGIRLSAETMKNFVAKKDSDEDLARQSHFYKRGKDESIDDVLDHFHFQPNDATTWWHVVDFLHHHGHHLDAGQAYQHAMPILPRVGSAIEAASTKSPIQSGNVAHAPAPTVTPRSPDSYRPEAMASSHESDQVRRYKRGVDVELDSLLDHLHYAPTDTTTWWQVAESLYRNDRPAEARVAQRHAVPPLADSDAVTNVLEKARKDLIEVLAEIRTSKVSYPDDGKAILSACAWRMCKRGWSTVNPTNMADTARSLGFTVIGAAIYPPYA